MSDNNNNGGRSVGVQILGVIMLILGIWIMFGSCHITVDEPIQVEVKIK